MKIIQLNQFVFPLLLILLTVVACSPDSVQTPGATSFPAGEVPPLQSGQVRQWAAGAEASTEFADPEWAAVQATDAPNTSNCGDYQTAWASAGSDTVDTLVLTYTLSVHVTGINIVQSFNPNQVSKVELLGVFDRPTSVYDGQPSQVDQPCPYTLSIPVEKTDTQFNKIRITVDQSILGLGWNQIDAVELVGDLE
jgi:hypothetical protein